MLAIFKNIAYTYDKWKAKRKIKTTKTKIKKKIRRQ